MNRQNYMAAAKVAGSALIVAVIALASAGCSGGSSGGGGAPPPAAPVVQQQVQAQAQAGQSQTDPKQHTLTGVASSPSGNGLTGTWQQTSGPTQVTLTPSVANNSPSFTFTATFSQPPQAGDYKFRLTVRDSVTGAQTVFDEVTVTIGASPVVAPMINGSSSPNVSGTVPFNVTFDLSGSSDSDGTISGAVIDPGDGSATINLNASNLQAVHQYVTTGTFTARLTVFDNENNPSSITVAVTAGTNNPPPPTPDPLVLNGVFVTESSLASVAPSSSATVFTAAHNQRVGIRGDFDHYPPTQLKAVLTNTVNAADKHVCPVVDNSDTEHTVLLPSFSAAAVYNVTMFAHAAGDVNNVLKNADIGNGPLQVHVIVNPRSTLVMSGEDTTANFNGSIYGLDIDAGGAASNSRAIVGGNGHELKGGFAAVNHTNLVYSPGFTGFQVKMFRIDTTNSAATISMDVNSAAENHSPGPVVVTRDGRPLMLTQEVAASYHVWLLKADLSGVDRHVVLNDAGQGILSAGTPIVGFYTIRMQETASAVKDYAVIVTGGTSRSVFMVPLEGSQYYRHDIDAGTGFSPQASCLTYDEPTGGFRIDMAGLAPGGTGTSFRSLVLRSEQAISLSGMVTKGASTNNVKGVQTFWQAANSRHLIWVVRQGESGYESRDNSNNLNIVHNGSLGVDRSANEVLAAPGLNGFIIGYNGIAPSGVAGVLLQPFDGSATTAVELQTTTYNNIAVGLQVFAIDTRAPFTATRYYHAPSATASTPQTLPARTGNKAGLPGIATP